MLTSSKSNPGFWLQHREGSVRNDSTLPFLSNSGLSAELIGKMCGIVVVMFLYVSNFSHLAISVNRIIAITYPLQVSSLLTVRKTSFVILICWTLGFLIGTPHFQMTGERVRFRKRNIIE
ncbi:hypothetical protein KIN20_011271 [Parelaphostrongylus tenuis]|uniref:G-protein coupled receptors family 1 profile domain-containing protein n=1 Tax=Parelaphostrongylus tenuis TaxID=148309 RepID=A0AAD5QKX9_PARTN|nr:hypothetical protein KIN20_011271 [Parelaphostrongylus tenuis]